MSHGAIFARSLGIPAVVAAGDDVLAVPDGTVLVVDGTAGSVVVDPAEVRRPRGDLPPGFEVGVMVEVPAIALQARAVAPHVDFFSVGSNDVTQYTLAAERGNAAVAHLADPLHPAVLRLIAEVAEVAEAAGSRVRVAVCGKVAGEPAATPLLVGLGVRELSMSPPAIPAVKDAVRSLRANEAQGLARRALDQRSAADVRAQLQRLDPP